MTTDLQEIDELLARYREGLYSIEELKTMRAELAVLLVSLGEFCATEYEALHRAEYQVKKREAEIYLELRKENTAADSERKTKILADSEHLDYIEHLGLYKRLDNMRQALLKVLDSMAGKMKDYGTTEIL
jgi:ABC-type enterochelin transport system substrate-binding protein